MMVVGWNNTPEKWLFVLILFILLTKRESRLGEESLALIGRSTSVALTLSLRVIENDCEEFVEQFLKQSWDFISQTKEEGLASIWECAIWCSKTFIFKQSASWCLESQWQTSKKSSTEFKASKLATQQIPKDFRLESDFETAFSDLIKSTRIWKITSKKVLWKPSFSFHAYLKCNDFAKCKTTGQEVTNYYNWLCHSNNIH